MFTTIFYQPIFNLLIFLYNAIPGNDLGVAIILLTLIVRFAMLPLTHKSIQSQKAMQELQPKIEEIKKQYAGNQQEIGKATMKLYAENKINPFSSCLIVLIQLPFLIAVYKVFTAGLANSSASLDMVYSFINRPAELNSIFLGFINLKSINYVLAVLTALAQFWQTKMIMSKKPEIKSPGAMDENMANTMNKMMLYMFPLMTLWFGVTLPGGLILYWFVSTVFSIAQQYLIFKKK